MRANWYHDPHDSSRWFVSRYSVRTHVVQKASDLKAVGSACEISKLRISNEKNGRISMSLGFFFPRATIFLGILRKSGKENHSRWIYFFAIGFDKEKVWVVFHCVNKWRLETVSERRIAYLRSYGNCFLMRRSAYIQFFFPAKFPLNFRKIKGKKPTNFRKNAREKLLLIQFLENIGIGGKWEPKLKKIKKKKTINNFRFVFLGCFWIFLGWHFLN